VPSIGDRTHNSSSCELAVGLFSMPGGCLCENKWSLKAVAALKMYSQREQRSRRNSI